MDAFSPRQRPRTVNLSFTDADLTDNFLDHSSLVSTESDARHPKGDTPLRTGASSSSNATVTSRSNGTRLGDSRSAASAWTNLDRLLDFLDGEDGTLEHATRRSGRATSSTPVAARAAAPTPRDPTRTRTAPRSSGPPAIPPSTTRRFDQSQESPDSPSPRPGSVAAMRSGERSALLNGGGGVSFQSSPSTDTARRLQHEVEAAYRDGETSLRRDHYDEDGGGLDGVSVDSIERVAQAALQEFDQTVTPGSSSHLSSPRSTLTRSANAATSRHIGPEDAAAHFDASMGRAELPPLSRSLARGSETEQGSLLPDHQARVRGGTTGSLLDPHQVNLELIRELREAQDYISLLQNELRTIGRVVNKLRRHRSEGDDEESTIHDEYDGGDQTADAARSQNTDHQQHRRRRTRQQSIGEEREEEANRRRGAEEATSDQDRVGPSGSERNHGRHTDGTGDPFHSLSEANRNAFEVVKHMIAMIPTNNCDRDAGDELSPTSWDAQRQNAPVDSIAAALEFTRTVDSLVLLAQDPPRTTTTAEPYDDSTATRSRRRRDEVVFEERNLARLLEVVRTSVVGVV